MAHTYRAAIHDPFDRPRAVNRKIAYIGEGLIDPRGHETLERISDIDIDIDHKSPQRRRAVLDSLAIDVGEKYLDDIYKENSGGGSEGKEGDCQAAVPKVRSEKELAWLKVRQLLIEEEEKASTYKKPQNRHISRSAYKSSTRNRIEGSYDTVKLLDAMAQSTNNHCQSNSNVPLEVKAPEVNEPPQTIADHIDRMGSRFAQFLQRGPASDAESSGSSRSWRSQTSSHNDTACGNSSQWMLLAALEQVTKTCQRMELSDASLERVSSHLALIDQIAREDIRNQQRRGARRLSSTQWSIDSSEYDAEIRDGAYPVASLQIRVSPTARNSFKAFIAAEDLMDTIDAFNNLLADCGLAGVKMEEPWHVWTRWSARCGGVGAARLSCVGAGEADEVQSREHAAPVAVGRAGPSVARREGAVPPLLPV
ncbi:unnamed protein product [Phytophthora lilii]|uniref:Unnamed protein product n=1 Tax=Phytophthora lilii TaxID=2077276 RepID=A0A9W7CKL1_9STRA|nr:unnamed protein product [Phytophthora lilii]